MKMGLRVATSVITGSALIGSMLFLPAWTFYYWQAWVFLAVFIGAGTVSGVFLAIHDPAALQRRMHRGPAAETRSVQKIVMTVLSLFLVAMLVLSALDHRFGWSSVPTAVSLAGNAIVVTGFSISMLVIVQNSYAAATITVEPGQTLVSTGLYGIARHPMYTASMIMVAGIPLALGSYWGLTFLVPSLIALVVRTLDEEKLLTQELAGYREYTQKVRYRLVPYVW
jgi:protein-S-isoprenylcysteine O-methyltransferase Ste14